MALAVRVTGQEAMDKVLQILKDYKGWAVAEEAEAAGRHMHAYVEGSQAQIKAKIRWALKNFSAKGNGLYSCAKVRQIDSYHQYMAKGASEEGQPEVMWVGMAGLDVAELHAEYWRINKQMSRVKECKDIVSLLVAKLLKEGTDCRKQREVAKVYYDLCVSTPGLKLDKYNCYRILDTAVGRLMQDKGKEDYEKVREDWLDQRRI